MGSNYVSVSFRRAKQKAVVEAIRELLPERQCFVSPAIRGWVTVYDADAERDYDIEALAAPVCRFCGCSAAAFAVNDDELVFCRVFDASGAAVAHFGAEGGSASVALAALTALAPSAAKTRRLADLLKAGGASANAIAGELGIAGMGWGYDYLSAEADEDSGIEGWTRFVHIAPPAPQPSPAVATHPVDGREPSSPWLFPRCLYGDAHSVRNAWAKVTRRAWTDGTWDKALADLEYVPLQSLPGDILYTRALFGTGQPRARLWRTHLIQTLLKEAAIKQRGKLEMHAIMRRFDHLMTTGMRRLWFTTGLLQTGDGSMDLRWERDRPMEDAWREFFAGFVRWLPELQSLSAGGRPVQFEREPHFPSLWMLNILMTAGVVGRQLGIDEIEARFGGDLAAAFLAEGMIERAGDRFVVREMREACHGELLDDLAAERNTAGSLSTGSAGGFGAGGRCTELGREGST